MRKIALILGGGGARGLAHVHVLRAFDDLGIRPDLMVGTSIGAIMAAAYASGMSGARVHDHVLRVLADRAQAMSRLWRLRPDSLRGAFVAGMPRLGELNAERVLRAFLPDDFPQDFSDLTIPLKVTATDFYSGHLTVIDSGSLLPSIAASIAIPGLFRPVLVEGRVHIDGGVASALSFELAPPAEYLVIAVDVVGMPVGEPSRLPSRLEAAFGASQLMMQALTRAKLSVAVPDLLIRPAVNDFRVLDFLRARRILESTAPTRDEARVSLKALLETEASR